MMVKIAEGINRHRPDRCVTFHSALTRTHRPVRTGIRLWSARLRRAALGRPSRVTWAADTSCAVPGTASLISVPVGKAAHMKGLQDANGRQTQGRRSSQSVRAFTGAYIVRINKKAATYSTAVFHDLMLLGSGGSCRIRTYDLRNKSPALPLGTVLTPEGGDALL